MTDPVERRLATILVADVYGYSRMMGENEERTVRVLREHRAVFDDLLKLHRGRVFNTAGDAILAEFPSAVEAVRCATEVQAALRTRNEHLPEPERMWFRIGINLGDVVVQGSDLLGDGVNVAARIQTVAEPGGVCISGSVYDQIQNKLTLSITKLGERSFKNIAQPVRTFAISDGDGPKPRNMRARGTTRSLAIGFAILGAIAIGGYLYRDHVQHEADAIEHARKAAEAEAAQKEARLAADLKAAQSALALAEAAKRQAEDDKARTETAQREAKLGAELRAAKEALAKSAVPVAAVAASPANADKYDGLYRGRVCKPIRDSSLRCWTLVVTAQHGGLSAQWLNRVSGNTAQASGSIAADGAVSMTIESHDVSGEAVTGRMTGHMADKTMTLSGTWSDGTAGNASFAWAPDSAPPTATRRNTTKRAEH